MKYVEKSLEKDDIIDALIKGGNNEKKAKELVDKHYNDVMKTYKGQNLTAKKVVDIILSFEVSDAGVKDPLRDSVQTFTVEGEVKIKQGDSVVILEAGDKIEVLRHLSETNITFALKQLVKDLMNAGFDYSEIGKELAKDVEWVAETTGNPKMVISGAIEYLNNYR